MPYAPPTSPTPLVGPTPTPYPSPPSWSYTPPTLGSAPTATPYGAFTAPDPSQVASEPAYKFRLSQGLQGMERGAAARGNLLTGGTGAAEQTFGQGLASNEYSNIYGRALQTYGANRDTNQQNFGQSLGSFNANLGAAHLGLDAATAGYDRAYTAGQDTYHNTLGANTTAANVVNANSGNRDAYAQQMNDYQASVEAQHRAATLQQNAQNTANTGRRPPPGSLSYTQRPY